MINVEQPFFEFFRGLPWEEMTVALVCMIVGALGHYVKEVIRNQANANPWVYFVKQSPKYTLAAVVAIIGAWATFIFTGAHEGMTWPNFIWACLTTGYVANSLINKGGSDVAS